MKHFLKRYRLMLIILLLVVVGGIIGFLVFRKSRPKENYVAVQRGDIVQAVYGLGTVEAVKSFQLKVGMTSTVGTLFVEEGDKVKKGDNLLTLDEVRTFSAPFDGVVTSLPYKEGETVYSQNDILTLTNFEDRYLLVSAEQRSALYVKPGQDVKLSFDGLREQVFTGKVDSVYSSGDRFLIRIKTGALPDSVLPGMTADVSITIHVLKDVLFVPANALDVNKVYRKRGKELRKEEVTVQIGIVDSDKVEIKSGDLKDGDEVLLLKE